MRNCMRVSLMLFALGALSLLAGCGSPPDHARLRVAEFSWSNQQLTIDFAGVEYVEVTSSRAVDLRNPVVSASISIDNGSFQGGHAVVGVMSYNWYDGSDPSSHPAEVTAVNFTIRFSRNGLSQTVGIHWTAAGGTVVE